MLDILTTVSASVSILLSLLLLGIVAGFSPTLYVTQAHVASKKSLNGRGKYPLILGVFIAAVLLSILFQFAQFQTLMLFIESTIAALIVSTFFKLLVALLCLWLGVVLIIKKPAAKKPGGKNEAAVGTALFSLGFARTFFSATGITAAFLSSSLIADTSGSGATYLLCIITFSAAATTPYVVINIMVKRYPQKLEQTKAFIAQSAQRIPLQKIAGWFAVSTGVLIILLQTTGVALSFLR